MRDFLRSSGRYLSVGWHIRHFHGGKGEAVIVATDPSSNVGSAICR